MTQLYIGIDLGGTKMLGVLMDERAEVLTRIRKSTDVTSNETVRDGVIALAAELIEIAQQAGHHVSGIGVGAPGLVNVDGVLLTAANLNVHNLPLQAILRDQFARPAVVLHDGKAAALGEAHFGAGNGARFLALITIGTGIGAGLVLEGRPYSGVASLAGEVGHTVIQPDGLECPCGLRGCLETIAAGPALGRQARQAVLQGADSLMLSLAGGEVEQISARTVAEAARQGDATALAILDYAAHYLGLALAGLINILDLECIIISGGLAQMGDLYLDPIRRATEQFVIPFHRNQYRIVPVALGNDAGAIGAATAVKISLL